MTRIDALNVLPPKKVSEAIHRFGVFVEQSHEALAAEDLACHLVVPLCDLPLHCVGDHTGHPIVFRDRAVGVLIDGHAVDRLDVVPFQAVELGDGTIDGVT
eukprot:CAMPEP_0196153224 /NCGR_PEP_ID=MMETSP0910-20130528/36847_1 /TAXON_ID=49265 /ORGANISM="Thalassiosira rotula, Strain GSO102" /LENGTH=100 /DNA_ID=CAMNT_0041416993 /DNA_START=593 /DNA_END=895 /DNA_ORIENTATION=-